MGLTKDMTLEQRICQLSRNAAHLAYAQESRLKSLAQKAFVLKRSCKFETIEALFCKIESIAQAEADALSIQAQLSDC